MNKIFVLVIAAISLFVSFGLSPKSLADRHKPLPAAPTPDDSSLLYLDKSRLKLPAPPGYLCKEECSDDLIINVNARGINGDEKKNVYKYTVSGGRVLGEGKNIAWDLTGSRPGLYTITVAVGDGEKTRESTAAVTVEHCFCPADCSCPEISVTGNSTVEAGETVDFTANVAGGTTSEITYNWTISQGEIIDGQGTPTITVKTNGKMKGEVKATVEVGELCGDCSKTASAAARIIK